MEEEAEAEEGDVTLLQETPRAKERQESQPFQSPTPINSACPTQRKMKDGAVSDGKNLSE